jgi:general secretion pathway protein J
MQRRAGFTLLEVLVAVTLLAVVSTLALGGLRLGARSWEAGTERLDRVSALHTSYRFLRQSLARAAPATIGKEGDPSFAFRGSDRELSFVVHESPRAGLAGSFVVALRVVSAGQGRDLRVVLAPFRPDEDGLVARARSPEDEGVLIAGASRIAFSYFGARRLGDTARWFDVWDAPHNVPRLVRLEVERADGTWPELVFAVAITMDADCAIFSNSPLRKCRIDTAVKR